MTQGAAVALAALGSLVLPAWMLLLVGIPVLTLLGTRGVLAPVLSLGPADVHVYDLVVVLVALRLGAGVLVARRRVPVPRAVPGFFIVLAAATALAYLRAGEEVFLAEAAALARLASQASVVLLLPCALAHPARLERACRAWRALGYGLAASIYADMALWSAGLAFGEVQAGAGGARYFGPLGDEVGFLLPLFIYRELLARNVLGAAVLAVAVLATGTRGAVIALAVGLVLLAWQTSGRRGRRGLLAAGALAVPALLAVWLDPGGMLDRFLDRGVLAGGLLHRTMSMELGLRVFLDHLLTGVGFTGFRFALARHDAVPDFVTGTFNQWIQTGTDAGVLGVAALVWLLAGLLRALGRAEGCVGGQSVSFFQAGRIWLLALALGNQSSAWLLPGSTLGYSVWLLGGMAMAVPGWRVMAGRRSAAATAAVRRPQPAPSVPSPGWTAGRAAEPCHAAR